MARKIDFVNDIGCHQPRGDRGHKNAFTLVELLIVIGIIALLISILLPAMNQARHAARTVVCASNLRQIGLGVQLYAGEFNGYFPGPNTSGLGLHRGGVYGGGASSPVQDWDWASPSIGRMLNLSKQLPGETAENARLKKFREIIEQKLRCPENDYTYGRQYPTGSLPLPGSGTPVLMSYSTPSYIHLLSSTNHESTSYVVEDAGSISNVRIPASYVPKVTKVGPGASKIFAFEGARYWDDSLKLFDYCTDAVTVGLSGRPQGAFHSRGLGGPSGASGEPYTFDTFSPSNPAAAKPSRQFKLASLRHNGRMQAVFFDGHVELMSFVEASYLERWAPTGTQIRANCLYNTMTGTTNRYPFKGVLP